MTNTLIQFRADETMKIKSISICEKLGIDLQTYLRMCMSRLVQENGIPFSMKLEETPASRAPRRCAKSTPATKSPCIR